MKTVLYLLLGTALAGPAIPAAAAVTYTLAGYSGVVEAPQSFSFVVDDYLSADTTIPLSAFTFCVPGEGTCVGAEFSVDDPFNNFPDLSVLNFQTDTSGTFYYFDEDAFTTNGVYTNTEVGFNLATLTVSGFAEAVPEPATWALMISGFGMVGAASRRRLRTQITYG
jgi:hypothetical protein